MQGGRQELPTGNVTARMLPRPRAQGEVHPEIKSQAAKRDRAELSGKGCQVKQRLEAY